MSALPPAAAASAAGAKRGMNKDHEARKESPPNKKARKLVGCPICLEEFDLVASKLELRVLPCNDVVCHTCLVGLIGMDRYKLKCPRCQLAHGLHDPSRRLSIDDLARRLPTAESYAKSLERNRDLLQLVSIESTEQRCTDVGCKAEAAHTCMTCGLQCEECSTRSHPASSSHVRSSLVAQRAAKQKELTAEAARRTAQAPAFTAAVERASKSTEELIAKSKTRLDADMKCVDSIDSDIQKLLSVVSRWKSENADRRQRATTRHMNFESERATDRRRLDELRAKADRVSRMSARALVEMQEAQVRATFNLDDIDKIEKNSRWLLGKLAGTTLRSDQHPAVAIVRQLNGPSLLPSLTEEVRSHLQEFLADAGKILVRTMSTHTIEASLERVCDGMRRIYARVMACANEQAAKQQQQSLRRWLTDAIRVFCVRLSAAQEFGQLLYRASRDGPLPKDFHRCCSEKGPTLTLIKAAGSGYLFGAYTAVSWPKPTGDRVIVPDPSGSSFLFSLTNAYDRPFRLSLVDHSRAIRVHDGYGPVFGASERGDSGEVLKFSNLALMQSDRDEAESSFSNNHDEREAYQLEAWATPPPNGFRLDSNTLAGQQYFVVAEIEVYTLDADPDSASAVDIDEEVSISPFSCAPAASPAPVEHS